MAVSERPALRRAFFRGATHITARVSIIRTAASGTRRHCSLKKRGDLRQHFIHDERRQSVYLAAIARSKIKHTG